MIYRLIKIVPTYWKQMKTENQYVNLLFTFVLNFICFWNIEQKLCFVGWCGRDPSTVDVCYLGLSDSPVRSD